MRDLIELTNIVTRTKLRSVELIGNQNGSSKMQDFYDLIAEGHLQDDDEAANHLYGKGKQSPSYQKLRKTLKDRLVNALFIIDLKQPSYTDRQTAYYACYQEWAAAKILFGKNARTAAETIARKLLKIARKYEFTELLVDICHTLRLFYGTIEGDYRKFEQHNGEFKYHEEIWLQENRAEERYIELTIHYVNSKSTKADLQKRAKTYYMEIEEALQKFDSYHLHLCGRLIEVSIYTSVNDYKKALDVCDRAIAFFERKAYVASVPLQVFLYQKCICHEQLREFDQVQKTVEKSFQYLEEGTFNWFKIYELYFLFHMHGETYREGRDILNRIMAHPNFADLPPNIQETWKISEAYLAFLEMVGLLNPQSLELEKASRFRLSKFLNEVEVFSKDKKGMKVPILIVEILLGIASGSYERLIDRVEAIDKYRTRYLREDELARSNCFLKMLLQIPKNAYRRSEVEVKANEDFEALKALPIETANQTFEIEIIPYERLWQYILSSLPE